MARGGYRPGAGRPKKGASDTTHAQIKKTARKLKQTPLEYMLSVMNDPAGDPSRRDRMAIAAAPFVHGRAEGEGTKGEREKQADRAKAVGVGKYRTPPPPPKLVVNNE